jgi:hypothetical protein
MSTAQANIWYNKKALTYLLYSPSDGVNQILEIYVGPWASGLWGVSEHYKSFDDLELDAVHYEVVDQEKLRETLLGGAIEFVKNP